MKQYKITSDNIAPADSSDDCYLAPDDPIHEIKALQELAGLGSEQRLKQLKGSNISVTGSDNGRIQREQNIKPGTPEWFKLWFSLPYMTGERKI
jgi:hypothetical protein